MSRLELSALLVGAFLAGFVLTIVAIRIYIRRSIRSAKREWRKALGR